MISNHVEDIIVAIKSMPNGKWRNKALSKADDLLAALNMLEKEIGASRNPNPLTGPLTSLNGTNPITTDPNAECICPPGARNRGCRAVVHNA